jgi:hypothetical protein
MPELFRLYGFVFFFFSHEHGPVHVHIRGNNGDARFEWDGNAFRLDSSHNIKTNDLKRIGDAIEENADIILYRWRELFGDTDFDDDDIQDMV